MSLLKFFDQPRRSWSVNDLSQAEVGLAPGLTENEEESEDRREGSDAETFHSPCVVNSNLFILRRNSRSKNEVNNQDSGLQNKESQMGNMLSNDIEKEEVQAAPTFQFTAEQLTKFVANVAIQIAQPQVCYPNPKQDMLNLKSSMCRKVSTVAKTILGVNITGKELFESIGSLSAPAPPKPFTFTSTQVNSASKTTTKPSTSKTTSPPKTSIKAVPKQPKSTT